ncbi:MAG TPA: hypothetical protein VEW69_06380 [Alphaproteobacteria bacterium]|nr:hypothetical protein [Alphaproteobacteria bacterium]
MISVEMKDGALDGAQQSIASMPPRMLAAAYQQLQRLFYEGTHNAVQKYFAAGGGPAKKGPTNADMLTLRSGALLQSVTALLMVNSGVAADGSAASTISASLNSPLPYAHIHEYGGVAGRAHFKKPDGQRPYLPPRPYLTPALRDLTAQANDAMRQAIREVKPEP